MNRLSKILLAVVAWVLLSLSSAHAQAPWNYYGGIGNTLLGFPGFTSFDPFYNTGLVPVPPYFALHPPVYYSYPVPRPYGYSPYAYPSTYPIPDLAPAEPQEVINPHVTPQSHKTKTAQRNQPQPLVVHNPYFNGTTSRAENLAATTEIIQGR